MMIPSPETLFADSLDRCRATQNFIDRFYATFLAASPEAGALFEQVNMPRQAEMLDASLQMIRQAGDGPGTADEQLDELGQFHARLGVPSRMYDQWLDCLVETVAVCDPSFSPAVATAWRDILGRGIERMKGGRPRRARSPGESDPTAVTLTGPTASPPG